MNGLGWPGKESTGFNFFFIDSIRVNVIVHISGSLSLAQKESSYEAEPTSAIMYYAKQIIWLISTIFALVILRSLINYRDFDLLSNKQ